MDDILPGVCTPLFIYLVFSLMGILSVMLKGGGMSGMVSFLIFVLMAFATLFINIFCAHGFASVAWIGCIVALGITMFAVMDKHFGNVDILGYVAGMVVWIIDNVRKVYSAFQYVTAKRK